MTYPELTDACRDAFQQDIGAPLRTYFKAAMDRGEVADGDVDVLTDRFTRLMSFTSFAILDLELAPVASELRNYAEQTVQLFLYGCAGGGGVTKDAAAGHERLEHA